MSDKAICKDCGHDIVLSEDKAVGSGEYQTVWSDDSGWVCDATGDEHEPLPPFTGVPGYEHDAWGNAICGHDFMAGTICTDARGHEGGHSATCLRCGNDWYDGSCTCKDPSAEEDETWRKTYSEKPDWWDDIHEPRCDECGVHMEEADTWDGECGNCGEHCTCPIMDPVEALSYAILAINDAAEPMATSGNDRLYLELHSGRALTMLARLREWVIAQGEDLPEWITEPKKEDES